ncbi:hypothetical protein MMB232_00123 [Brevundimonas subvibrioides]|uniref:hypothetical protein n=1 Tax=Brevundimonas subvibrioides TaxID=74313 RepID=UPI0032D57359
MRLILLPVLSILGLSACAEAAEPAEAPAAPVQATTLGSFDLAQPIRALGTEPFWTVDVAGGTITWRDESDLVGDVPTPRSGPAGTPAINGATAVWTTQLSDGTPLMLTLTAEACPDIGEETRALKSVVQIGDVRHEACADARSVYPEDSPTT